MRNTKNREAGLMGSGGIVIDGDISLKFHSYHSSSLYLILRIVLALFATISTAFLANSFCNADLRPILLIYNSFIAVLGISLLTSKHKIIKISAAAVTALYVIPILLHLKNIKYGFYVAANGYLTKGELPEQSTGIFKHVLKTREAIDESLYYFFAALILITAIGTVLACIVRIDFPILFIFTFPVFELGLYLGFEVPTIPALMMLVSWVTLLSMNIINHTTNKAGRGNTFAVHEKSKTFYFTSSEAKAEFYSVYIRFVALLTACVFLTIVLASKISGFHRPDSFSELRYNLHNAFQRFDVTHADDFLIDVNGGSNLFGVTTVGGTNGGILGTTNGISFNGSKALIMKSSPFNYTMYLRGYVAGDYSDNKWQPLENDSKIEKISKKMNKHGMWLQDYDHLLLDGSDNMINSTEVSMDITVKGACSKFIYAPYATNYSYSYSLMDESSGMTPYNDSYVRISQSNKNYTLYYKSFENSSWEERINDIQWLSYQFNISYSETLKDYNKYVHDNYTEAVELSSLDEVYNTICNDYLPDSPDRCTYIEIYNGIKKYFSDRNFTYNTEPGKTPDGVDFIDYFLTEQKSGYCTYYATVGAQLMRKFGYPARYIEGYMVLPSQLKNSPSSNGIYEVTVKDRCAHAWAEVFIDGVGWMPAEFTPGYDNNNPNLSDEEKGLKKPESSSVSESSKNENENGGGTNSKPQNNNSKSDSRPGNKPNKPANSKSDNTSSEKEKDSSSKAGGNGSGHGNGKGGDGDDGIIKSGISPAAKTVLLTLAAMIIAVAAVIINRRRNLDKMHDSCSQKDLNKRVMSIYSYSLKYLSVLNIEVKRNISDMQMCGEILSKCHEQRINELDDMFSELTMLAVKACMRPESITEDEAASAERTLKYISEEIVAKKLNTMSMLSAKYLYCLY